MSEKDFFGPALPPENVTQDAAETDAGAKLVERSSRKRRHSSASSDSSESSSSSSSESKSSESNNDSSVSTDAGSSGKQSRHSSTRSGCSHASTTGSRIIGPVIPPGVRPPSNIDDKPDNAVAVTGGFIGPILPASASAHSEVVSMAVADDEDDEELVGPVPITDPDARAQAAIDEIEKRSKIMKDRLLGRDLPDPASMVVARDTWMTELPPEIVKNFGVTARTFSTKVVSSGDKDRSGWTDTPADRARKLQELREGKQPAQPPPQAKSIAEMAAVLNDGIYREQVDQYNRLARPKSLLEMHSEKIQGKSHKSHHNSKKKKKSKDGSSEEDETDTDKKKKKKKKKKKSEKRKKKDKEGSEDKKKKKKKKKEKKEKKVGAVERRPFDREKDLQVTRMDDAQRKSVIQRSAELSGRFGHGGIQFL